MISDSDFNSTGFLQSQTYQTSDGEMHVSRPDIYWSQANSGLVNMRTGACSVAIPELGEMWVMGGMVDVDPQQTGDEMSTNMIEKLYNSNKTWSPPDEFVMVYEQQYCEAEYVDDFIYVIGEWNKNSNPFQEATGVVQIYNMSNQTWFEGERMPASSERGLGGMAAHNGSLYYAGGITNAGATDHSNQTWKYDISTNTWSRMANMTNARSSFPLVNYHDQLYAIGGMTGTSTWNRLAIDYVERYDPITDTWTNLSSLPVGIFGSDAVVYNDEIVIVGGYNGGPKKTVYHWNPIDDTWRSGQDIVGSGHFDITLEVINGSIIWASGDKSSYAYSNWGQQYSSDSEYQNETVTHSGWITSPIIDLRPLNHSHATPVEMELLGTDYSGGKLGIQYRTNNDYNLISFTDWRGHDGTINSTYSLGQIILNHSENSNFFQYRIEMEITDLENWDEPNLDSVTIVAEHAGINSIVPTLIHPRSETMNFMTSHYIHDNGTMGLAFAMCNSNGYITGPWSNLTWSESSMNIDDVQGLFISAYASINGSTENHTNVSWQIDFNDLVGISYLCLKTTSQGKVTTSYLHPTTMEIDRNLEVIIDNVSGLNSSDSIIGDEEIEINISHYFSSTGMSVNSGNIQARLTFSIAVITAGSDHTSNWTNITTSWNNLTIGTSDTIVWTPPNDISGRVDILLEARSDQPFTIAAISNSTWLILDNENPIFVSSIPVSGTYINSQDDREISVQMADTSGFILESVFAKVWVQGLDDGSDGTIPDAVPQISEFRIVNHTMENEGTIWWFNITQSDSINADHDEVHFKLELTDTVGNLPEPLIEIYWETRDSHQSVIEQISNENSTVFWEISRDVSWGLEISDENSISDVMFVEVLFGNDTQFGFVYEISDSTCYVHDDRINQESLACSHYIYNNHLYFNFTVSVGWSVDLSLLEIGKIDVFVTDIDGIAKSTYQDMWIISEIFDTAINSVDDITGEVTGNISNQSIVMSGDTIQLIGTIFHDYSGLPFEGELSMSWYGTLQGISWYGGATISVVNGVINSTITMPLTGGLIDFTVLIMDPFELRTLITYDIPTFVIDSVRPILLDNSVQTYSRYHLDSISIGINMDENVGYNGNLTLTCQVRSTEIMWDKVTQTKYKDTIFQGITLFSFNLDMNDLGDPSELSPEARIDCWANGIDDSGWNLLASNQNTENEPWISLPLNNIGPNIQLVEVNLEGNALPGDDLRIEIVVKNSGESLTTSFSVTVYVVTESYRDKVGSYTQGQIASGQGIVKRVLITVPNEDWTLEVLVDEEQQIWELDENDNYYSETFTMTEEDNKSLMLIIGAISISSIITIAILIMKKKNRSNEPKNMPKLEDLPRGGDPVDMRSKSPRNNEQKAKKGPPPKANIESTKDSSTPDIGDAMNKLSLEDLPGNNELKVTSYEKLPGGGDYQYLAEGTFYIVQDIGKWKLEEDGSFSKVE